MNNAQPKTDIIPAQRRKLIRGLIRQKGVVSVHELFETIGVSLPTIRCDPDYHVSFRMATEEKATIGLLAVDRLPGNQRVI